MDAQDLKQRVDLRDVVRHLWGAPHRSSARYDLYRSRWRDDGQHASFTVYATHYKDFGGAGEAGDVFGFIQRELNLSFTESAAWLADFTGGSLTLTGTARPAQAAPESPHEPPDARWQQAARAALIRSQRYLWSNSSDASRVRAYLREQRGLTDATLKAAGYGYNPHWDKVEWRDPDTGKTASLAPGIIEPWFADGALWALRVRCRVGNLAGWLKQREDTWRGGEPMPKYLNLAGSKQAGGIYNGDALSPDRDALIVEGGFDCMLAQQTLGADLAVVTFGSASTLPNSRRLLQLRQARRVYLLLDSDTAGQGAQERMLNALGEKAVPLRLPAGKDVGDFIMKHGGDLRALIAAGPRRVWWPSGMPDSFRSAFLAYFRDSSAPVLELLNRAMERGLLRGEGFTIREAVDACAALDCGLSDASIRRVIADLTGWIFAKVEAEIHGEKVVPTFAKPAERYRALTLADVRRTVLAWAAPRLYEAAHRHIVARPIPEMLEAVGYESGEAAQIAAKLDALYTPLYREHERDGQRAAYQARTRLEQLARRLNDTTSTPLPDGWPLDSAARYRAAFLRATNDPQRRRSRREMCELLGVADSHLERLLDRAGLHRMVDEGEFEVRPVRGSSDAVIEQAVREGARAVKGFPRSFIVRTPDGQTHEQRYSGPEARAAMVAALGDGGEVLVKYQVANHYESVSETPPEPAPRTPPEPGLTLREPRPRYPLNARRRPFFGPQYDPDWVRGQFGLAGVMLRRLQVHAGNLVDRETGEIVEPVAYVVALAGQG
jgi:hypothetical protein